MVDLNWGMKRTCQSCFVRFYDMQKKSPKCPKCGTEFSVMGSSKHALEDDIDIDLEDDDTQSEEDSLDLEDDQETAAATL